MVTFFPLALPYSTTTTQHHFARWIRVFHHNVEPFCAQCRAEGRMLFNTTHRRYVDVLHVCTAVDFSFVIP